MSGPRRTLRITLEYDGTRYAGWQVQPGRRTIQGALEEALATLCRHPSRVLVAGRTDAGVHAEAQVCRARTDVELSCDRIVLGLNGLLPSDIAVAAVDEMPSAWHPRYDALGKHYRYRLLNRTGRPALRRHRCWHVARPLDLPAMRAALEALRGTHHFGAFRAADCPNKDPVKELRVAELDDRGAPYLDVHLVAGGFLKQMARVVVGTVVEVGQGRRSADEIPAILASRDRRRAGRTAPASGLCLIEVLYGDGAGGGAGVGGG